MPRIDAHAFPPCPARDVQQTAQIAGQNRFRARGGDVADLVRHHAPGNVRVFHAERPAEAATDLRFRHLHHRDAQGREQFPGLFPDAQFAQTGAGIVIGEGAGQGGSGRRNKSPYIHEKTDQLERLRRQPVRPCPQVRIVVKQMRKMRPQHAGTGTGGRDDMIVPLERIQDPHRQIPRGRAIPGVVRGLAATGLGARHLHLASGLLQQP